MSPVLPPLAPDAASALPVIATDLKAIDTMAVESFAVFCFADVRPLFGAAQVLDWRLSGRLSRALERGHVEGKGGEVVLLPGEGRNKRRRVFLFGLGEAAKADRALMRGVVKNAFTCLAQAGARDAAFVAPAAGAKGELEAEFLQALAEELSGQVRTVLVSPPPEPRAQKSH
ncbi:MAG: hypothetical protein HY903_24235 [Deltaproteobacteria bacterium]|nr:hypothetical protein [Deltaproteobacteria bacterium]